MLRLALVALIATSACRLSLDDDNDDGAPPTDGGRLCKVVTDVPSCVDATSNQSLSWIEQNVFSQNCGSPACHSPAAGGGMPSGRIVLTTASHDKLLNATNMLASGVKLVVPNNVNQSYLMVLMRHLTPAQTGLPAPARDAYMPLGTGPVCCQKLDALERWIMAGAPNN
jgi:hypothetical protein